VTIKDLLGHAQIHTTADIYAHVRLRLQRDAIKAMGNALGTGEHPTTTKTAPTEPDNQSPRFERGSR
jgi:hypothetical protein